MNVIRRLRNPVLVNELKLRMRTKRSPWIIFLYLLALGGISLTMIFLVTGSGTYYRPDQTRELFMMLSMFQLAMICFVVPGLTAGVISGERERQTLPIMLTTNVSATKLILGKWLASLGFMMFLIVASLPLYTIVFLYGGISPEQLVKVFGFYLVTMLGFGSVGVLLSTLIKRTGVATVLTYAIAFGYTAGTAVIGEVVRQFIRYQLRNSGASSSQVTSAWPDFLNSLNPFFGMLNIFEEGPIRIFRGGSMAKYGQLTVDPYWIYCAFLLVLTVIFLGLAIYYVKPVRPRLGKRA
ncbi:ABC transporter permease [Brevibacillus fluminis]|uniref:ABC transporter permease n=1 Tax=Brevibacillus fluminis TaxID=511487 RepID=A0A3M8CV58_9BACL|nr:ABC transporter permease [Brevibacillus fluminis]RNB79624.1 ABC transporter permease [Brevibacillus fluminis]